jgi:two-component system CheB/CheR fusion protein
VIPNESHRSEFESTGGGLSRTSGADPALLAELYATIEGLRQGNVLLRHLFDANVIGILLGPFGVEVTDANELALRALGYSRDDLRMGQLTWDRLLPGESRPQVRQAMDELADLGFCSPFEVDVLGSDGERNRILFGAAQLEGTGRAASFVIDLTDQRRAEQALRESEQRIRAIIAAIPDLIFRLDREGVILGCLSGVSHDLFSDSGDLVGSPLSEFIPASSVELARTLIVQALESGRVQVFEYDIPLREGRRFFEARITPSGAEEVLAIVRDVTERTIAEQSLRASARRFQALIEKSWDAIALLDLSGRITYASPATTRILGYSQAELIGLDPLSSIHPEDHGMMRQIVRRLVTDPGSSITVQYRQRRKDGAWLWIECTGTNLLHESEVNAVVVNFHDITAAKQAELATLQEKNAAESANLAKDQFLAVLSHELRTPLAPILTAVQLMETESGLSEDLRSCIDIIHRNIDLEVRLIDDLLDLTRIARGKVELAMETVDVHELIRQAVAVAQSDLIAKGIRVELHLAAGHPVVQADPARLQQVFWNIVKNAVKFTPNDGEVIIRTSNTPGGWVTASVTDTGIGIDRVNLDRIFSPFDQGEETITKRFGGLGLGLAISRNLVEMHGGRIEAFSAGLNRGATFSVHLPNSL